MGAKQDQSRVALITGSTSGIGKAIAERLSEDGFTIAFHSRSSMQAGEELVSAHNNATYTQADLADPDGAKLLIEDVLTHHGRLDVLVNNAGINAIIPHDDLKQATPQVWRDLYDVNVIAQRVLQSLMP